jgi:ferredoxin-NADP reductase
MASTAAITFGAFIPQGWKMELSSISGAEAKWAKAVEVAVQATPNGEISPFLVHELAVGDEVEVRGPVGGWFTWEPAQPEPILLVGGGSGITPLMAMLRERRRRLPVRRTRSRPF